MQCNQETEAVKNERELMVMDEEKERERPEEQGEEGDCLYLTETAPPERRRDRPGQGKE
jgi:hypothetical protein